MITPLLSSPFSTRIPVPVKRKRVLLVDASPTKRELRADAMRKLGIDVDCACEIGEVRTWWRADLYNFVFINVDESRHRDKFYDDVRTAMPPRQMAFLVGQPQYLSQLPNVAAAPAAELESDPVVPSATPTQRAIRPVRGPALPWGIMEASRRISAVCSTSAAHATAIRNRPTAPRDLEVRVCRRDEVMSQLASELQKQELQ